jgi:hypothetical protein
MTADRGVCKDINLQITSNRLKERIRAMKKHIRIPENDKLTKKSEIEYATSAQFISAPLS